MSWREHLGIGKGKWGYRGIYCGGRGSGDIEVYTVGVDGWGWSRRREALV